jgi:hypothetical protein
MPRDFMKYLWWVVVALVISAVLNTIAVMVGRGSYEHITLVLYGILLVGFPTFVASLILMIMGQKRWNLFFAGYVLNLVSLVVCLMIASGFIGLFVASRDVKDAKAYCESLVPRLEKYKDDKGEYPEQIDEIVSRGTEPEMFLGKPFYMKVGKGYSFEFRHPSKKMEVVGYSSWRGTWEKKP